MEIAEFKAKLEERDRIVKDVNKHLKKNGKAFVLAAFKGLFEKHPELESFAWEQAQYYNDMEYYFDLRYDGYGMRINGERLDEVEETSPLYDAKGKVDGYLTVKKWCGQVLKEVGAVLKQMDRADFQTMFGESTVTVTKNKIKLEACWGDC